jgi:hypothetical protein
MTNLRDKIHQQIQINFTFGDIFPNGVYERFFQTGIKIRFHCDDMNLNKILTYNF